MKTGRGNEIGYVETQLMIPRAKKVDSSVIIQGGGSNGVTHAMWGYTYEIPNFIDTVFDDIGFADGGDAFGFYWQYEIPVTTIVDQVGYFLPFDVTNGIIEPTWFGLYDLNQSPVEFPLVVRSAAGLIVNGQLSGAHFVDLQERVTIPPGLYALAYLAPCFDIFCINGNIIPFTAVNDLWVPLPTGLSRYGSFTTTGPHAELPDVLDASNVFDNHTSYITPVVMTYWDDSQEFAA